jgi:hypothetical protein
VIRSAVTLSTRRIGCAATRWRLPASSEGGGVLAGHLRSCLACQAEAARERQITRSLAAMRSEVLCAPASVPVCWSDPMAIVPAVESRDRRVPVAVASVASAAAIALAVGVSIRARLAAA